MKQRMFAVPDENGPDNLSLIVRNRLRWFLTRAFRHPVREDMVVRYSRHVESQLVAGVAFADAMKNAASTAIASPAYF